MTIDEYFAKNGIKPKTAADASKLQLMASKLQSVALSSGNMSWFFDLSYEHDLDVLGDCIDFDLNKRFFRVLKAECGKYDSVFEPCCQSGILGCFLADKHDGTYKGMDINRLAIAKAKKRAELNGLNPDTFVCGDFLNYNQQHDALLGRYVLNSTYGRLSTPMFDAVCKTSKNIILLVYAPPYKAKTTAEEYRAAFRGEGFDFEVMGDKTVSQSTGSDMFAIKAKKR